ncbi:S1 family peptidase, partial [Clostridium botulinum]|uniref:S1 family peptidase n=1 Tax=Clostridium botulinum TaxID=1491 RepID=UPI0006A56CC1
LEYNYSNNIKKMLYICDCEYNYFFNKKNVVGVGVGYKIINNFYTSKKCITVFVSEKVDQNNLPLKDLIPAVYKGIETDVVQSGYFVGASLTQKIRPVQGGYSVGPESASNITGSQGCVVTDGTRRYMLSCNHIIAHENMLPRNTQILQPSLGDGGKTTKDAVAYLTKYIPLKKKTTLNSPENDVDCAIAREYEPGILSSKIYIIGDLKGVSAPNLGRKVVKSGRTTAYTEGSITTIGATVQVKLELGIYIFKHQIITTSMGQEGDSGAVLVDENKMAVGLLCAVAPSATIYNPMNMVLSSLGVHIVTG